ncbi:hypothetical protein LPJ61_000591 [Coemansia biformis]|uniref:Importin N-terminal domain-containing protein n=1 Tax=Coemansia biformis TaxID=1286918 RepID=A0A9W7YFY0_9FUNG|nr:hypothetical protein LPJ61_000591 [Coemansia biformis]
MERQLYEALRGTLSAEDGVRTRSELALRQLEQDTQFPLAAATVAMADEAGLAVRQAAAVQLRGYVGRHWTLASAHYEPGPIPDQQIKAQVRERAFALLVCSDSKLRSVAAAVVAGMAVHDWPDEWPQLFGQLAELLRGDGEHAPAALCVFNEWVGTGMSEQQIDHVSALIPELRRIFGDASGKHAAKTRAMAVSIFVECIDIFAAMAQAKRDAVDAYVRPVLEEWVEPILAILRQPTAARGERSILLKTECAKALVRAITGLPRHLGPYCPAILETLWMQLRDLQEPYLHAFVYQDSEHNEAATSMLVSCEEDGDVQSIDGYLCTVFEWIARAAQCKPLRRHFVAKAAGQDAPAPTPFLNQLAASLMSFAQITGEMLEDWADDMDLFVADEDEEGYRFSVRVSVQELLGSLELAFPQPLAVALVWAAQVQSDLARRLRDEGSTNWWLVSEAVLWAAGAASECVAEHAQGGSSSDGSTSTASGLGALLDSDVWPLARCAAFPYGQGRAFVFASSFADTLPPDVAAAFVGASADAVANTQLHPAVRLSAVRAIGNFCRRLSADLVRPRQGQIISGLATVIPQLSEDSAHIALEALHVAVRVGQDTAASLEPVISDVAMGVWRRYPGDVLLTGIVIDIVEAMASNGRAREAFSRRALPIIGEAITQPGDDMVVSSGIDLLSGLLKGVPSPMPPGYLEAVFPPLMQALTAASDWEVLQSGQACLKYIVQKDAERVAQWRDGQGKSGLELIFRFVAALLLPDASESRALFVGDLVTKIVQKCSALVTGDTLAELVRIVTARLATARTASFSASLLPFYAQLVVRHPAEVVDLLAGMSLDGRSGLHVMLSAWFTHFLDVQGYYARKVSATALTRLFALNDPRVGSFMAQGDLIPNAANAGKIVTRSMSRTNPDQYTAIPATAKIVKLLLAEMDMDVESQFARSGGAGLSAVLDHVDMGDEDGWEDDGDGDSLDEQDPECGYGRLSDFISEGGIMDSGGGEDGDEDEDDEDVQADPIYNQDLNEALGAFLKQLVGSDHSDFRASIEPLLTERERKTLGKICV